MTDKDKTRCAGEWLALGAAVAGIAAGFIAIPIGIVADGLQRAWGRCWP